MGSGRRAAAEAPRAATRRVGAGDKKTSEGNLHIMQIMRARAGQRAFCAAHNSEHYVELPTTEHGWAGSTERLTKPGTHAGGKAQPAAEPQALGPVVWGEGRRGGVRAETEGATSNEATEGIAQVAKATSWPEPPEHCPVCQATTAVARRDACRAASKRRDGRSGVNSPTQSKS